MEAGGPGGSGENAPGPAVVECSTPSGSATTLSRGMGGNTAKGRGCNTDHVTLRTARTTMVIFTPFSRWRKGILWRKNMCRWSNVLLSFLCLQAKPLGRNNVKSTMNFPSLPLEVVLQWSGRLSLPVSLQRTDASWSVEQKEQDTSLFYSQRYYKTVPLPSNRE